MFQCRSLQPGDLNGSSQAKNKYGRPCVMHIYLCIQSESVLGFVCLFDCLVCSDWFIMYFSSSLIILGTFQYSKSVISCRRESFQFIVSPKFPEIIKRYGFRGFIDLILIVSFPWKGISHISATEWILSS